MAFYENTIVAKQDLAEKELKDIKDKYNDVVFCPTIATLSFGFKPSECKPSAISSTRAAASAQVSVCHIPRCFCRYAALVGFTLA